MMARSNEVTLKVTGRSVHVSRAAEGLDALRAGVDWMNAAYAWTEALPPDVLRTLQFGRMTAGTVRNAVAGSAEIQGTLRTYDEDAAEMIRSHLRTLAAETAERTAVGSKCPSARATPPSGTTRRSSSGSRGTSAQTPRSCSLNPSSRRRTSPSTRGAFPVSSSSSAWGPRTNSTPRTSAGTTRP